MIVDTSDSLPIGELLQAIRPEGRGFLVVRHDSAKKLIRTKVRPDQAAWFLNQLPSSRHVSISLSSYLGKNVLPNFCSTRAVSVTLDLGKARSSKTCSQLFVAVCEQLDACGMPLPTFTAVTPSYAKVVWVTNTAFEFCDLGRFFSIEKALAECLSSLGASPVLSGASQFIPLPQAAQVGGQPVAFISSGGLRTIDADRLFDAAGARLTLDVGAEITRNCEVIDELGSLLFSRSLEVSARPQLYWLWVASYAAATGGFVENLELKDIVRSVVESLESDWADAKDIQVPGLPYKYESYLDIIVRNMREAQVRLGTAGYFPIFDHGWIKVVANELDISQQEVVDLRMSHLRPSGVRRPSLPYYVPRQRIALGREDFVSLHQFLQAA